MSDTPEVSAFRYCEDCVAFRPATNGLSAFVLEHAKCAKIVASSTPHPVARELGHEYMQCQIARRDEKPCGPDAKLFEPRAVEVAA